jgi:hypothetical protein
VHADLAGHLATRSSYFRGAPTMMMDPSVPAPFKEWLHFCVLDSEVKLLVNLSLMSRTSRAADRAGLDARVVVLAEVDGKWIGGLDHVQPANLQVIPGRVDARFGGTRLRARSAAFELSLEPGAAPISARLRLEPITLPILRPRTSLGGAVVNWLAAPRLRATGTITVGGRPHFVHDASAYHDHNWGHWRWGQEFFWQWAFGLPTSLDDPWTAVFYRMFDRSRTTEHARALLLWRGPHFFRIFRDDEVGVRETGFLRPPTILKIPSAMALLAPQLSTDVSAQLTVEARSGRDDVRLEMENCSLAQLIVPNDADLGTTIINEVVGGYRLRGEAQGVSVESAGQSFHEHVTHG